MGWETSFAKIINWTIFCAPNSNWGAGWFGQVFQQCNVPRSIQFTLHVEFSGLGLP